MKDEGGGEATAVDAFQLPVEEGERISGRPFGLRVCPWYSGTRPANLCQWSHWSASQQPCRIQCQEMHLGSGSSIHLLCSSLKVPPAGRVQNPRRPGPPPCHLFIFFCSVRTWLSMAMTPSNLMLEVESDGSLPRRAGAPSGIGIRRRQDSFSWEAESEKRPRAVRAGCGDSGACDGTLTETFSCVELGQSLHFLSEPNG